MLRYFAIAASSATATATTTGGEESLGGGGGFETAPPPAGGEEVAPPPPAEGGAPEGGEAAVTPESRMKNMNLLIESNLLEGSTFLDLGQGQQSLGEISKELDKLLNS